MTEEAIAIERLLMHVINPQQASPQVLARRAILDLTPGVGIKQIERDVDHIHQKQWCIGGTSQDKKANHHQHHSRHISQQWQQGKSRQLRRGLRNTQAVLRPNRSLLSQPRRAE